MQHPRPSPLSRLLPLLILALPLAACGEAGDKASRVVEAASTKAAELGQQFAEKASEIAEMAPEQARAKLQGLTDTVGRELREIRDTETARKVAEQLEVVLQKLLELKERLSAELDLAGLRESLDDMRERFANDPRVQEALGKVREKLDALAR